MPCLASYGLEDARPAAHGSSFGPRATWGQAREAFGSLSAAPGLAMSVQEVAGALELAFNGLGEYYGGLERVWKAFDWPLPSIFHDF